MPDPVLDAIETIRQRNRLHADVNRLCKSLVFTIKTYHRAMDRLVPNAKTPAFDHAIMVKLTGEGKSDG